MKLSKQQERELLVSRARSALVASGLRESALAFGDLTDDATLFAALRQLFERLLELSRELSTMKRATAARQKLGERGEALTTTLKQLSLDIRFELSYADSVKLRNAVRKWAKPLAVDSVLRGAWNVFFTAADHAHRESFMQLRPDQTQALLDELEPLVKKLLAVPTPSEPPSASPRRRSRPRDSG